MFKGIVFNVFLRELHVCSYPGRPEKRVVCSEVKVTDSCVLPNMYAGNSCSLGLLQVE